MRPGYARALKNRAAAYSALKQPESARADLDEAVRLGSRPDKDGDTIFRDALHQRALLRLKADDDKDGAIDDLDRAIQVDPSFASAFFWRGMLRDALGDRDRAIADRERNRELEPKGEWQVLHYESRNRRRHRPWQR